MGIFAIKKDPNRMSREELIAEVDKLTSDQDLRVLVKLCRQPQKKKMALAQAASFV